jgi:hypothetical protein
MSELTQVEMTLDEARETGAVGARRGRGKSESSLALVTAAKAILEEIQPATVRAVCYRLFVAKMITDMGKNSTGKVSKQLVWAREQNIIPWHWIVDEGRYLERTAQWDSIDERIDCAVKTYRRDNWNDQPQRLEVWSEKGTVRGTIGPILRTYGVGFRVMHGYTGASTLHTAAINSRYGHPLTILYIGDYDPSGLHMSEIDIPQRLERYEGKAAFQRIALRAADTVGLPSFPAADKKTDSRFDWFARNYGDKCWELDAYSPPLLRQRVEQEIKARLDMNAWEHALKIERAEIAAMKEYGDSWKASISRLVSKCLEVAA